VTYTDSAGNVTTLPKQIDSSSCGTGWYYNDPVNPTTATLCPATCSQVKQDTNARVEIHLGCPSLKAPGTFRQTYQAKCNANEAPQWGYLGWEAAQPAGTKFALKVRSAPSIAALSSATFAPIGSAPSDPASCPLSGPAPCPKDLYNALGGSPSASYGYLEVEVDTTPYQAAAPTVNDVMVSYSCVSSR
jgi:hypothetical protein